ncbi:multicopper oxidase [Cytobacillus sp. IB215665]|uniref:multicopper oxidase family protein n=1 Tax=Cytobacillus sp. IB215665 TaxID=3097357 RepID=UPI002A0CDBAD|nr:multicopper oxidase [Cytobacillus sp. IB215665]MDX8365719.1 multicopper oxidase [Cytobacillus sp. IB215665]
MNLLKFIDKLPIPRVLQPVHVKDGIKYYEVTMTEFQQSLHSSMPKTRVWGYEHTYPGPVIEVSKGERIRVKWINDLPSKHFLPIDKTVHGAGKDTPEVRTVVHLHGGITPADSDGYPDAWFTNGFKQVGPFFEQEVYEYENLQDATTLWYHDHAIGITRLNIYAGLAGYYLIRSKHEQSLNLPKDKYEIPLLLQDRTFNKDGSLYYPSKEADDPTNIYPSIVAKFMGENILVNGKVWPYLEVEPRKYRFRLINGSNARYYKIRLDSNQPFFQIGTDGGLLEKPVTIKSIILGPAERADVIIDFSSQKHNKIVLINDAKDEFPEEPEINRSNTRFIMQFRVTLPLLSNDTSTIPQKLTNINFYKEQEAIRTRHLELIAQDDRYGRRIRLLDYKTWDDPITEKPALNDIEIWSLSNPTTGGHPIHLHLVKFQILDKQLFDVEHYEKTKQIKYISERMPPAANDHGWKDVINVFHGETARIIAKFAPYTGRFVWHCHILEHEDYEMMRPFDVVIRKDKRKRWKEMIYKIFRKELHNRD